MSENERSGGEQLLAKVGDLCDFGGEGGGCSVGAVEQTKRWLAAGARGGNPMVIKQVL